LLFSLVQACFSSFLGRFIRDLLFVFVASSAWSNPPTLSFLLRVSLFSFGRAGLSSFLGHFHLDLLSARFLLRFRYKVAFVFFTWSVVYQSPYNRLVRGSNYPSIRMCTIVEGRTWQYLRYLEYLWCKILLPVVGLIEIPSLSFTT
jgi:hypothetical protein